MKWHHSLYWRIAVGFVSCLALLLLVQAMLFVWVVSRSAQTIPNQPPDRFAQTVALDASQALERDSTLDLAQYLRQEYARDAQPFFVLLARRPRDRNRRILSRADGARGATALRWIAERKRSGPFGRGGQGVPLRAGLSDAAAGSDAADQAGRPFRPALIRANNEVIALVVVPPEPPFSFLLARYAPTLGLVAVATLIVGAILATAVIFGPARKRLRSVEDAARRLGGRRPQRSRALEGPRRSRGRGHGLQCDGRRSLGSRRSAGVGRSGATSTARRRVARAHHAGDGDARLPRNIAHAGTRSRRAHAGAISRHHRRRDGPARTHHRRSPGPRAAGRRRRRIQSRGRLDRRSIRTRRCSPRTSGERKRRRDPH